jgi:hypothetical protein
MTVIDAEEHVGFKLLHGARTVKDAGEGVAGNVHDVHVVFGLLWKLDVVCR